MAIHEIRHPLIRHKLGLLRRADISTKNFRELAQEVTMLLTYEATKDLPVVEHEIDGWNGSVTVDRIAGKKITVVPILRAGFYYVAVNAGVPIALAYMDYEHKKAGVGKIIHPTGNFEEDMAEIMDFYAGIQAKFPEEFSVDQRYYKAS